MTNSIAYIFLNNIVWIFVKTLISFWQFFFHKFKFEKCFLILQNNQVPGRNVYAFLSRRVWFWDNFPPFDFNFVYFQNFCAFKMHVCEFVALRSTFSSVLLWSFNTNGARGLAIFVLKKGWRYVISQCVMRNVRRSNYVQHEKVYINRPNTEIVYQIFVKLTKLII